MREGVGRKDVPDNQRFNQGGSFAEGSQRAQRLKRRRNGFFLETIETHSDTCRGAVVRRLCISKDVVTAVCETTP